MELEWELHLDQQSVPMKLERALQASASVFVSSVVLALLYVRESWKLSEKLRRKLNAKFSKMLSKLTGRDIADEAKTLLSTFCYAPGTYSGFGSDIS